MANEGFIKNTTVLDWTFKIGATIMSILMMLSSFFLTKAWESINNMEKTIVELKIEQSKITSNRFSTNDWVSAKTILDAERLALDRRLIRIEETYPIISESIFEIKQTLRKLETTSSSK